MTEIGSKHWPSTKDQSLLTVRASDIIIRLPWPPGKLAHKGRKKSIIAVDLAPAGSMAAAGQYLAAQLRYVGCRRSRQYIASHR